MFPTRPMDVAIRRIGSEAGMTIMGVDIGSPVTADTLS